MGQHHSSFIIHHSSFIHTIRNTIYDNNSDCKSDLWSKMCSSIASDQYLNCINCIKWKLQSSISVSCIGFAVLSLNRLVYKIQLLFESCNYHNDVDCLSAVRLDTFVRRKCFMLVLKCNIPTLVIRQWGREGGKLWGDNTGAPALAGD